MSGVTGVTIQNIPIMIGSFSAMSLYSVIDNEESPLISRSSKI